MIAPIQIVEERTIGPTPGMQNIEQGLEACLAYLLVSILFMIIFYKKFGLIATSALIANLILIVGIMSLLPGATLSMPYRGYRLNPCGGGRCERTDQRTY